MISFRPGGGEPASRVRGFRERRRSGTIFVIIEHRSENVRHRARSCQGPMRADRILILNRRQLEHVLRLYTAHYNRHRPHRSLSLRPPDGCTSEPAHAPERHIRKHELLGGLIHEHEAAA